MVLADNLAGSIETNTNRRQPYALTPERVHDPSFNQIAETQKYTIFLTRGVLGLPEGAFMSNILASFGMIVAKQPSTQRLRTHADHSRRFRSGIDAYSECGLCHEIHYACATQTHPSQFSVLAHRNKWMPTQKICNQPPTPGSPSPYPRSARTSRAGRRRGRGQFRPGRSFASRGK